MILIKDKFGGGCMFPVLQEWIEGTWAATEIVKKILQIVNEKQDEPEYIRAKLCYDDIILLLNEYESMFKEDFDC